MHNSSFNDSSSRRNKVVALGEVLWDILPTGPRLGGASANMGVMSGRLGDHAILASRIGADVSGTEILDELRPFPIDTSYVQVDSTRPTGSVTVQITGDGEPSYVIHEDAAWDAFELTPSWQGLASTADAVCFGTLAQRTATSRATIQTFLSNTSKECLRVFDINLRQAYYSEDMIRWSLGCATVLKLNEEELQVLAALLGIPVASGENGLRSALDRLMFLFPLHLVCLTLGSRGSLISSHSSFYRHPGVATNIADTVGAGDAFLAAVTHYALQGASVREMSDAANAYGSWVASESAAIPPSWPAVLSQPDSRRTGEEEHG
jgi:fructokinase